MKQNLNPLSQQYAAMLEKHLKQGPRASLLPALNLGRQAVGLGLETLDLARIHEQALVTLELSNLKNALTKLAGIFFTEANTAIEATHRAARQAKADLSNVIAMLGRRTEQLAASNRQLQKGVVRRRVMEDDFAKKGKHHHKRLEESLDLQKRLRQLTHQVLAAQEDERKKISRELQDEIAQTLLGINVRLLSLKHKARTTTTGLKNEIASTQRLVAKSAQSVRQVGRKIGGV
jgi:two-component system sensor histidine kinase DegS